MGDGLRDLAASRLNSRKSEGIVSCRLVSGHEMIT